MAQSNWNNGTPGTSNWKQMEFSDKWFSMLRNRKVYKSRNFIAGDTEQ